MYFHIWHSIYRAALSHITVITEAILQTKATLLLIFVFHFYALFDDFYMFYIAAVSVNAIYVCSCIRRLNLLNRFFEQDERGG